MENIRFDFARLEKAMKQECRNLGTANQFGDVMEKITKVLSLCGEFSQGRKVTYRIGKNILLSNGHPKIIVPVCPDYSHKNGKYTFCSLGSGVSLLTERHLTFLGQVREVFPELEALLLIADHEADDQELCRVVGKTHNEFAYSLSRSVDETKKRVKQFGWEVDYMTNFIKNLVDEEKRIIGWISAKSEFQGRIKSETLARSDMYRKISRSFTSDEMMQRTIKTAAQYIALGQFAACNSYLVCNHTTTNLSWYLQTDVAVLHNPISVY